DLAFDPRRRCWIDRAEIRGRRVIGEGHLASERQQLCPESVAYDAFVARDDSGELGGVGVHCPVHGAVSACLRPGKSGHRLSCTLTLRQAQGEEIHKVLMLSLSKHEMRRISWPWTRGLPTRR